MNPPAGPGRPTTMATPISPDTAARPVEGLTLGPGLVLPVEAVTETFAILAKRGAGKTYTAAVLMEEMMGAGLPVVIVDPVGVWWGLRSSADGTAEGLPVVIFGGDHADLPLAETAGELLADLVARARGRRGGCPSKLSPDQVQLAQRLYDTETAALVGDRRERRCGGAAGRRAVGGERWAAHLRTQAPVVRAVVG